MRPPFSLGSLAFSVHLDLFCSGRRVQLPTRNSFASLRQLLHLMLCRRFTKCQSPQFPPVLSPFRSPQVLGTITCLALTNRVIANMTQAEDGKVPVHLGALPYAALGNPANSTSWRWTQADLLEVRDFWPNHLHYPADVSWYQPRDTSDHRTHESSRHMRGTILSWASQRWLF